MSTVTYRAGGVAGTTRYVTLCRLSDGLMRRSDTGAYEAEDDAHWANYAHPMSDPRGLGQFEASVDVIGTHWLSDVQQAGGTPAKSDLPSVYDVPQFNAPAGEVGGDDVATATNQDKILRILQARAGK